LRNTCTKRCQPISLTQYSLSAPVRNSRFA
jgi:hypothetical protein